MGLEVDPTRRFPSIEALRAAIEKDPTARRRRVGLAVGLLAGLVLALLGSRRVVGSKATLCRGGADRWASVWPRGQGQSSKEAIHTAFTGLGKSYAEQTFASVTRSRRLRPQMDQHVHRRLRGDPDTRRTVRRGARPAHELPDGEAPERARPHRGLRERRRNRRRERRRGRRRAALVDRCGDVGLLKSVIKPPEQEAQRARVEGLRRELARLIALRDAGHCGESNRLAGSLIPRVREAGYPPLLGETLLAAGYLSEDCAPLSLGEARFEEAFATALAARDDETAAVAAMFLGGFRSDRGGNVAEGRRWPS